MKVEYTKLSDNAIEPSVATPGSAGLDLYSTHDAEVRHGQITKVSTGIALTLPGTSVGVIKPRSGLAFKHGIDIVGGVIDNDFRGEIIVGLTKLTSGRVKIEQGQKIAQMLIHDVHFPELKAVNKLGETLRGDKGFGSSDR
jgi:dUTP pyrophosphatase